MNTEQMQQIIRHNMQESFAGNLKPLEAHPGLHEVIPTVRYIIENTYRPSDVRI